MSYNRRLSDKKKGRIARPFYTSLWLDTLVTDSNTPQFLSWSRDICRLNIRYRSFIYSRYISHIVQSSNQPAALKQKLPLSLRIFMSIFRSRSRSSRRLRIMWPGAAPGGEGWRRTQSARHVVLFFLFSGLDGFFVVVDGCLIAYGLLDLLGPLRWWVDGFWGHDSGREVAAAACSWRDKREATQMGVLVVGSSEGRTVRDEVDDEIGMCLSINASSNFSFD